MKQLVSQFANMTSKTPILGDLESLVSFMKTDEKLKFLTQSYRQTGKKTFKADAPLFAPACHLEGGKGQDNIRELTHLSLVDFDELFTEVPPDITALNALKQKLCADPHTLLCYITMSGNGIRVIYPYLGDDYPAAFAKGNDYYQQLIGKKLTFNARTSTDSVDSPTIPMHTTIPMLSLSQPKKSLYSIPRQLRRIRNRRNRTASTPTTSKSSNRNLQPTRLFTNRPSTTTM